MLKTYKTFNWNKHGPQSKLNKTQLSSQNATVTTDHQELTAKLLHAPVPTDHSMDQLELHALEPSQPAYHTTTLTQLPEDHMPPQVTLLTVTHLHQSQPKLLSNLEVMMPPLLQPRVPLSHHQRRSQSSTQRSARPTPLSMDKKSEVNTDESNITEIN